MASDLNDEAFRQELLDLFALEAQEWLQQAKDALKELEGQSGSPANPKLLDVIQQGMSNLGGSAATVELPEVEQMAYAVLPTLESIRKQGSGPSAEQSASLQGAFEDIDVTIHDLAADSGTGSSPPQTKKSATAARASSSAGSDQISVDRLKQVAQDLAQANQTSRNLVELVIHKAGIDASKKGGNINGPTLSRILRELEGMDEEFLAEVQRWMPQITEAFARLKTQQGAGSTTNKTLDPLIKSVDELHEAARRVNASSIVQFSRGLRSFLGVVANEGTSMVNGKLQAVEFRLAAVIPMVRQWVEMGKIERTAIGKVFTS